MLGRSLCSCQAIFGVIRWGFFLRQTPKNGNCHSRPTSCSSQLAVTLTDLGLFASIATDGFGDKMEVQDSSRREIS